MEKVKIFFKKNRKRIIFAVSFLIFLFSLLLFFTYIFYIETPFLSKMRSFFRLPMVIAGGSWITFDEFDERVLILKNNFQNQDFSRFGIRIDFETEEGKKRFELEKRKVLVGMIEERIVKNLAKEHEIFVTDEMINMEVERLLRENLNSSEKIKEIEKTWGNMDNFKEFWVYPSELRNKLEEHLDQENITDEMRNNIKQAKKELEDGRLFADVVRKYSSDGITKEKKGVFGWFKSGQLIKEVNDVAFSIEPNKYSDIIESRVGFHIIKVSESKTLENGEKIAYVNQIIVKKKTLLNVLEEELNNISIFVFVDDYIWVNECKICNKKKRIDSKFDVNKCINSCFVGLEFSDKEMQDFSKEVQEEYEKFQLKSQ